MKKHIIFTGALLLASALSTEAMADCNGIGTYTTHVTTAAGLSSLIRDRTICATAAASGEQWHEYHNPTGSLEKIGDGTAVDPNVAVGSWSVLDETHISYAYTGNGSYSYEVYTNGSGGIELCGATRATGTLQNGKVTSAC